MNKAVHGIVPTYTEAASLFESRITNRASADGRRHSKNIEGLKEPDPRFVNRFAPTTKSTT